MKSVFDTGVYQFCLPLPSALNPQRSALYWCIEGCGKIPGNFKLRESSDGFALVLAESAFAASRLKIQADIDFAIFHFRPVTTGRASKLA